MAIYDELGGRAVVELVVDLFYRRVLADPALAPYFADIDLGEQIRRQCLFLAFATGRFQRYDGNSIKDAHRALELNDTHFDAVAAHLAAALGEVGAPGHLIARVMAIVGTSRADIVSARDDPPATR